MDIYLGAVHKYQHFLERTNRTLVAGGGEGFVKYQRTLLKFMSLVPISSFVLNVYTFNSIYKYRILRHFISIADLSIF